MNIPVEICPFFHANVLKNVFKGDKSVFLLIPVLSGSGNQPHIRIRKSASYSYQEISLIFEGCHFTMPLLS